MTRITDSFLDSGTTLGIWIRLQCVQSFDLSLSIPSFQIKWAYDFSPTIGAVPFNVPTGRMGSPFLVIGD